MGMRNKPVKKPMIGMGLDKKNPVQPQQDLRNPAAPAVTPPPMAVGEPAQPNPTIDKFGKLRNQILSPVASGGVGESVADRVASGKLDKRNLPMLGMVYNGATPNPAAQQLNKKPPQMPIDPNLGRAVIPESGMPKPLEGLGILPPTSPQKIRQPNLPPMNEDEIALSTKPLPSSNYNSANSPLMQNMLNAKREGISPAQQDQLMRGQLYQSQQSVGQPTQQAQIDSSLQKTQGQPASVQDNASIDSQITQLQQQIAQLQSQKK